MDYIFTFLEGIASFISPCILPMLPIYISYFLGKENKSTKKAIINSVAFTLGFTTVFVILSIFASQISIIFGNRLKYIKILFGIIVILLGLNYTGILRLNFINKSSNINYKAKDLNFIKSLLFGAVFAVSWTPCIGTFLSSALLLVAKQNSMARGILLILVYSLGLGIPFVVSTIFIEKLKDLFTVIKKNYKIIKIICGIILILMGIYMIIS